MFWPLPNPHFSVIWPALPWKASWEGVIWLPLGMKGEISRSWNFSSPIITFPGGLRKPRSPSKTSNLPNTKATTPASPWCSGQKWCFAPLFFQLLGLASARLGKLLVRLQQRHGAWLQPLKSCWFPSGSWGGNWRVPCERSGGARSPAGSRESEGGPELLTKPTLFLCAFLLVIADA